MIENQEKLFNLKNVCGVGETQDKIVVFVEKKEHLSNLQEQDIIPDVFEGKETDVIQVGKIKTMVSGAPVSGTSCTIGAVCYKDGKSFYLQNAHCLPSRTTKSVGEDFVSPSPADGSSSVVGRVSDWSVLRPDSEIRVDALIAESFTTQTDSYEITQAYVGANANSWGRTSSYQEHQIVATNVSIDVRVNNEFNARFTNQIMFLGKVRPGDSGATLKIDDKICGLIFASNGSNVGFANDIREVMAEMDITFTAPKKIERRWRYFTENERTGNFGTVGQLKIELVDFLDEVRHRVGFPIIITSGYRTPEHNKRVGGAPNSAHLEGFAADVLVRNTREAMALVEQSLQVEREWYNQKRRLQLGINCKSGKSGFVHIGLQPNRPQAVLWTY
jgi:hypothetical protein